MDEEKIIIKNKERFEKIKANFIKDGLKNIHVITDFDGTLTKTNVPGKEYMSIIHLLRLKKYNYLGEEYAKQANKLFEIYHPAEIDVNMTMELKKEKMTEWWKAHLDLLIESKLKQEHIEKVCLSGVLELKEGCKNLFSFLNDNNVPIIIMSANAIGDTNATYLDYNNCLYNNISFITNRFKYDENGFAIGYFLPVITSLNKDETVIKDFPEIFEKVKDRKNVILIGDGMGDPKMSDGFEYDNIIKIGFLHEKHEENLEYYKNNYDVVLIEDNSIEFVNGFLKNIK